MLNIYAQSFMTATRTNAHTVKVRDVPAPATQAPKRRWLPVGHWWVTPFKNIDLDSL